MCVNVVHARGKKDPNFKSGYIDLTVVAPYSAHYITRQVFSGHVEGQRKQEPTHDFSLWSSTDGSASPEKPQAGPTPETVFGDEAQGYYEMELKYRQGRLGAGATQIFLRMQGKLEREKEKYEISCASATSIPQKHRGKPRHPPMLTYVDPALKLPLPILHLILEKLSGSALVSSLSSSLFGS